MYTLPDETTFTEMRREEDFHAQFRVIQKEFRLTAIVFATGHSIIRGIRVRVRIIRSGIGVWSRVLRWSRSLLQQADVYTKL